MATLITLVLCLLLLGLVWWVLQKVTASMPDPIGLIIQVIMVIAAVLLILGALGYAPGFAVRPINIR
jgi:hypothetical protein